MTARTNGLRVLAAALCLLAGPALASVTVTGTMTQSDDVTPCFLCTVEAQQVSNLQGSSVTYAGNTITATTDADGAWELTLTASTNYQFRFYYSQGGLAVNPPEVRTTCASGTCTYPTDCPIVSGGSGNVAVVSSNVVKDDGTTVKTDNRTFNFTGGIAAVSSGATQSDISVDSTVVRTTGAQTIAGVKTLSSLPTIPLTPVATTDAASKGYVDTLDRLQVANTDGTDATVDGANELTFTGGDGVTTSGASATVTIAVDGTVVRDTGNESIAGVKTFESLPLIPETPTLDTHPASKGYVDDTVTAQGDDQTAAQVPMTDAGAYYTTDNVEAALQQVGPTMTNARTPSAHAASHQNGGSDEISVAGLSGELADAQPVNVRAEGVSVGTRSSINLIEGSNVTLTVDDNVADDRIDVTIDASASGGSVESVFKSWVPTAGTTIVADDDEDTATITSTEGTIAVTGTAATDTLNIAVVPAALDLADIGGDLANGQLAAGAVDAAAIADGTVGTDELATGAVASVDILDATILAGDLADGAVTSAKILDATIVTADIATGGVATADILDETVASVDIADGTLVNADVSASAAVDESKLAFATNDGSRHDHDPQDITGAGTFADALVAESNVTQHEAALSIAETQVPAGALLIRAGDAATGDVTGTFADGGVALEIAAGAVGTAEIADGGVASADVALDTLAAIDIATGAVTTAEVLNATLLAEDYADGSVGPGALASTAVTAGDCTNCDLSIDADGRVTAKASGSGAGGEANTASNLGGGLANYSTKVGVDLRFNSFAAADFDLASNVISVDDTKWAQDVDLHSAVTLAGEDYLTLGGQEITAAPIDLSGSHVTGALPAASVGNGLTDAQVVDALTISNAGDITLETTEAVTSGHASYDPVTDRLECGDGVAVDQYPSVAELGDASGTIVASLAVGSVGAAEIDADAVGTSEIATDGVDAAEIVAGAVGTSELADGSVGTADIGADVIIPADVDETAAWDFGGGKLELPNATTCAATDCDDAAEYNRICIDSDATTGQRVRICESTGWVLQGDGTSAGVVVEESNASLGTATNADFGLGFDLTFASSEAEIGLDYTEDPVNLATGDVTGLLPLSALPDGADGEVMMTATGGGLASQPLSGDVLIDGDGLTTIQAGAVQLATDVSGTIPYANLPTDVADVTKVYFSGNPDVDLRVIATTDLPAPVILSTEIDTFVEYNALTTDQDFVGLTSAQTISSGEKDVTAKFDFGSGTLEIPNSTTLPATCVVGEIYLDTNATTGEQIYACTATDTWTLQGDGDSGAGSGDIIAGDTLSGDVTATMEDDGDTPVSLAAGSVNGGAGGEIVDGTIDEADWASQVDYTGTLNLGGADALEIPNATTLPATCSVGEVFSDTNEAATRQLYLCTSANTWTLQDGSPLVVEDGDVTVTSLTYNLDFNGTIFAVTESPSNESNVTVATGGISATELAANSVANSEMADDAIGAAEMADGDHGDVSWSSGVASVDANAVALTTDTTGDYVASVATTSPLSGGAAGSEGGTLTLSCPTCVTTSSELWQNGTNGYFSNTEAIIVGADAAFDADGIGTGAAGDLKVTDDVEIGGDALWFASSFTIAPATTDAADNANGSIGYTGFTRGGRWTFYGNEDSASIDGSLQGITGKDDEARVSLLAYDVSDNINTLTIYNPTIGDAADIGWAFESNVASNNVALYDGVRLFVNDWIGIGSETAAGSACLDNDGADRLYHDTDCDGTKDGGEEYIDQAGGAANSFTTFNASSGTDPEADSATDTLAVTGTAPVTVTGDSTADSLTLSLANDGIDGTHLADTIALDADLTIQLDPASTESVILDVTGTPGTGPMLLFNHAAGGTMATGISMNVESGSGLSTGIDLSDPEITNAVTIGGNNISANGTAISSTEVEALDGGIALTTETTGDYVASVATTSPITGGAAGSEGATLTIECATCTTASNTQTLTEKTFDAAGSGNVLKWTEERWFPAQTLCFVTGLSAPAAATLDTDTTASNQLSVDGIQFLGSADNAMTCQVMLPADFDAAAAVSVALQGHKEAAVAACDLDFEVRIKEIATGEDMAGAWSAAQATAAGELDITQSGNADYREQSPWFTLTETLAASDALFFEIMRDADDATHDDCGMTVTINIDQVGVRYGVSK